MTHLYQDLNQYNSTVSEFYQWKASFHGGIRYGNVNSKDLKVTNISLMRAYSNSTDPLKAPKSARYTSLYPLD